MVDEALVLTVESSEFGLGEGGSGFFVLTASDGEENEVRVSMELEDGEVVDKYYAPNIVMTSYRKLNQPVKADMPYTQLDLIEKIGVENQTLTTGPYKDAGSSLRRMNPRRAKLGVEQGRSAADRTRRADERRKSRPVDGDALDEVDRILDKIRDSGIESLTEKERAYLDDMSRRYRGSD